MNITAIESVKETIKIKEAELWDAQNKIFERFKYNTWPSNDQYKYIRDEANDVIVILGEISALKELQRTIQINAEE